MSKEELAQQEKLSKATYPMTFEKDKIGGALADAFNAGFKGLTGGIYRFRKGSPAYIFYKAGIEKSKTTTK